MFRWMQSITAKVLGIAMLALVMLIPLSQADGLVRERQAMRDAAFTRVAEGWGGPQTVGGLVLAVPTRYETQGSDGKVVSVRDGTEIVLADEQSTVADLAVDRRRVGMYEVPVYTGEVTIHGRILPEDLRRFTTDTGAAWYPAKAELRLLIADTRGLQGITALTVDGHTARLSSSTARMGPYTVLSAPVPVDPGRDTPLDFALTLRIAGTGSFSALPLARTNTLRIRSPWPDPSFTGALLPGQRSVGARGFDATWRVLDLNRAYGQHWDVSDANVAARLEPSASGVKLYQPGGVYQQNDRAGKYGLLFIALTFVAFFLFEILKGLRLHPVQYLLVGAAMTSFYVLLLALSEQIGFGSRLSGGGRRRGADRGWLCDGGPACPRGGPGSWRRARPRLRDTVWPDRRGAVRVADRLDRARRGDRPVDVPDPPDRLVRPGRTVYFLAGYAMNFLAIETSTEACSVALVHGDEVIERSEIAPRRHAELVLPMADDLLAEAGLKRGALHGIAVGRGPGAFTGVRLGVSLAQGMAMALDVPVVTVSSLQALALEAPEDDAAILSIIDARMGEIYVAAWRREDDGGIALIDREACRHGRRAGVARRGGMARRGHRLGHLRGDPARAHLGTHPLGRWRALSTGTARRGSGGAALPRWRSRGAGTGFAGVPARQGGAYAGGTRPGLSVPTTFDV